MSRRILTRGAIIAAAAALATAGLIAAAVPVFAQVLAYYHG